MTSEARHLDSIKNNPFSTVKTAVATDAPDHDQHGNETNCEYVTALSSGPPAWEGEIKPRCSLLASLTGNYAVADVVRPLCLLTDLLLLHFRGRCCVFC